MRYLRRNVVAIPVCALLLLLSAGAVCAQPAGQSAFVASSFNELRSRVQPGTTIFVTDSAGRETSGKLGDLSDTSLELLLPDKAQTFAQADVRLVKRRQRDSLWNGMLIGAAMGVAPAIYWLIVDPNECGGSICMSDLATGVIPGALIGLAIDAVIQQKVIVYRSPRFSARMAFTVGPIVAERRKGVELTISF